VRAANPPPRETRTISLSINRPLSEVYAFVSVPENFSRWASGLGGSRRRDGGTWMAAHPAGPVTVQFTEPNDFGILDHRVTFESGAEVYMPMRVIARGNGTEVLFTLFREPDWSDERLAVDIAWVERDLNTPKRLLDHCRHRSSMPALPCAGTSHPCITAGLVEHLC
jgi:hypothetical protein